MTTQKTTFLCPDCGRDAPVVRGSNAYTFDVECDCGRSYQLAYSTAEPPPLFGDAPPRVTRTSDRPVH